MRPIKMKSGTAWILEDGETCPPGGVCFLEIEWAFVRRDAKSREGDPDDHRAFWECLLEAKKTIPGYVHMPPKLEKPALPVDAKTASFRDSPSGKIAAEIQAMLRGHNGVKKERDEANGEEMPLVQGELRKN